VESAVLSHVGRGLTFGCCSPHPFQRFAHRRYQGGRIAPEGSADSLRLEQLPYPYCVDGIFDAHPRDEGAVVRQRTHQSLLFELPKGLAKRTAAEPEVTSELHLIEARAGPERAVQNGLPKPVGGSFPEKLVAR
jgi:hypothetical protein